MNQYAPIAIMLGLAGAIGVALLVASSVVGKIFGSDHPSPQKESPYECGVEPVGDARTRFPIRYYLVALVFVVFDLEAVFIYPWAVSFRDAIRGSIGSPWWQNPSGGFVFGEMLVFMGVLAVGLLYLWKRGALDWE